MAAWVTITASDLEDYQASALVDALRNAALGSEQADPFDTLAADRVAYIQNRISGRVKISATPNTIPPELKTCACWLILEAMLGRLGMNPEDIQDKQITRAYRDLEIAGTKDFPVSAADDAVQAEVTGISGGAVRVTRNTPRVTRENLKGL